MHIEQENVTDSISKFAGPAGPVDSGSSDNGISSELNETKPSPEFLGVNPVLPVNDVIETARFYEEVLGFHVDLIWEEPAYACVSRGQAVLEFGEARPNAVGSTVCYVRLQHVDSYYEELKKQSLEFVSDLANRHYGSRDFRVRDNNGNLLIFGSALPTQQKILQASSII